MAFKTMLIMLSLLCAFRPATGQTRSLKVFLDCGRCDASYQKRELAWVEFVRDPAASDVHVWVVSQGNSSGGRQFTFQFIGKGELSGQKREIHYNSENSQTRLEIQQDIFTVLTGGLLPLSLALGIVPDWQDRAVTTDSNADNFPEDDPWNYWVFEVGTGFRFRSEQQRRDVEIDGDIRINRTTEQSRLRVRLEYDYEQNLIFNTDGDVRSTLNNAGWEASQVWSLGPKWSAGVFTDMFTNSVVNTRLGIRLNPALEFNVYPYSQSHLREFTIAWYGGPFYRDYHEETLFGKTSELLFGEQLSVDYRLNRPWGHVNLELDAFHYFDQPDKNRLTLEAGINIRLARGLFAGLDSRYSLIHDQIYLPKGDIPIEDVLLRRSALATTFQFSARIRISYTFGSVYNSIVNTRL